MNTRDLWRLDATAQAALVRAREVKPDELVACAIERIERLNPRINAVITPLHERARQQAGEQLADAPFAGVPLLVKDASLQIEGTRYCLGAQILRDLDYRSDHTTELARRFERAGFIVIGKTNVPLMSSGVTTEPAAFGPTRNPWQVTRTAGGSSGGSAAAVAAGMTSIAHGGDAGGSLRYPAACCGLVTLKPSRGRVPCETPTGEPDQSALWAEFVLTRSVRDLAGALAAVGEPAPRAANARPDRTLRIGLLTKDVMSGMPVDQDCVAAVERTGTLLASLGHRVDAAHPPALEGLFARALPALTTLINASRADSLRWLESIAGRPLRPGDVEPDLLSAAETGAAITAEQKSAAQAAIEREIAPIPDWWRDGYDILVTPTIRQPAWPLGGAATAFASGTFPFAFSMTGQPAMSLPLALSSAGLPVGVQIVGEAGRDELLLKVAADLEAAAPWADRWPPLALD
jgi:amidase